MAVTQTISTIPEAGHRGIDAREAFVTKQEAFQDALTDTFVPEINTIKAQINNEMGTLNVAVASATTKANEASASANLASTKASEANSSANQALTYKNQVQNYVIPAGTSYSVDQINTQNSVMTKAQFNALAEERKANRAGSGFEVPNSNVLQNSFWVNVQNGMKASTGIVGSLGNNFAIGGLGDTSDSPEKICISGITQKLAYLSASTARLIVELPTAPNIYPYDTVLTAEQIASGVIKHADASNSGLVVMGKNLSGTTFNQTVLVVNGKKYLIEYKDNGVRKTLEITASSTSYIISLSGTNITEVGMYPADAISRSDLVFLESWHEDVSEKNFVYPLGNVQYLGGNSDGLTGIVNAPFTGFGTYSLFGNWQTPSALIGKGYVWSSLTEAQKRAFISNSENNCYLDGDKVIQARYRVRVVQGAGDVWQNPNDTISINSGHYGYLTYNRGILDVQPKGKQVSILAELKASSTTESTAYINSNTNQLIIKSDIGAFTASDATIQKLATTSGYEGKCYALPIALVHRRNQGMYHPVYNPNGTKLASDSNFWYNTTVSFTSISDCFDPAKLLTSSGYIGTVSGRPDGLFYDQAHEGDILDLRNSSKKVEDYNRLINREFNKLVAGTYRGKQGELYTEIKTQITTGTVATVEVNDGTKYKSGDVVYIYDLTASTVKGRFVVKSISSNTLTVDVAFAKLTNSYMISGASSTRTKSNTLLVCDVIGNPVNYPSAMKTNEVTITTLHTAEEGTSLLPNGVLDSFKLSRKANATPLLCLRSTDNGATWTSFTPTFNTTTNAITLTDEPATNLVMVFYQTHTRMAVPVVNSEVLETGSVLANAFSGNSHMVATLIGKIPTTQYASAEKSTEIAGSVFGYAYSGIIIFIQDPSSGQRIYHNAISLSVTNTPAVKIFPYLTRLNGKAYLNLVFKEMKHNGTSWGDDSKFNIVDNVSTTTDNNAATILVGQKTVELPYFIGADE